MATRSSLLYLNRKKVILHGADDRPRFLPERLKTHFRPHTVLPELRNLEETDNRLATQPLNQVKGQIERIIQDE